MNIGYAYVLISAALVMLTLLFKSSWMSIILLWAATSFLLVSIAYLFNLPSIFRKKSDGRLSLWVRGLHLPFFLCAKFYNTWAKKRDLIPNIQEVRPNLFVSSRLLSSDIDDLKQRNIDCIVDVTAEFSGIESQRIEKSFDYLSIPALDHRTPKDEDVIHAINWIDTQLAQNKSVAVHCALGRGRSIFVIAAYLIAKETPLSIDDVLKDLNQIRQTARLNSVQYKELIRLKNSAALTLADLTWLIANPAAGGGKWKRYRAELITNLCQKYRLKICETTQEISAKTIAQTAIADGAKQILAAGGDGTIAEVASVVDGTDTILGIIPLGTANALCHLLYGITTKVSPIRKSCDVLVAGKHSKIDTAKCNDDLVLLVIGIGFEHEMIAYAHREQKNQHGQFAYLSGFFNALSSYDAKKVALTIDKRPKQNIDVHSLVVANAAPFTTVLAQGGATPSPNDGFLHITYLKDNESMLNRIIALSDLTLSSLGLKEETSIFEYELANEIEISSDTDIEYAIDGETKKAKSIKIKITPNSLNVFVP